MKNKDYWYPWYPVKFQRKTIALNREQRHAYRDLIDWYMQTGEALPDSEAALANITGLSLDAWRLCAPLILPFFNKEVDGLLHNQACDKILSDQMQRTAALSAIRSESGKAGANARWNGKDMAKDSKPMANAWQNMPTPHHTTPHHIKPTLIPLPASDAVDKSSGFLNNGIKWVFEPTDETLEALIEKAPRWDRQYLVRTYQAFSQKRPRPDHPQAAFLGWVKRFTKGKPPT